MTFGSRLSFRPFPYRKNSLNLFRLIFAVSVLFAHSWYVAGRGIGPQFQGENLGGWAVAGFFVVSGFLITGSRMTHSAGEFLVHRIGRIFPAFLVCLAVTAFVFGPTAEMIQNGSLAGYFSRAPTPVTFIWSNLGLKMNNFGIGDTLQTVPYRTAWNGSLWTLYYEFLSYLIIWVVGGLLLARRSVIPTLVLWALSVANWVGLSFVLRIGLDADYQNLSQLLPYFLGGAVAYYAIRRFGVSTAVGVTAALVSALLLVFVPHWGGQLAAPAICYALLWLSTLVPQPGFITRNDISYGFYIYAWPVQQLIALVGGYKLGMWFFWLTSLLGTLLLAIASWILVERPALNAARGKTRIRRRPWTEELPQGRDALPIGEEQTPSRRRLAADGSRLAPETNSSVANPENRALTSGPLRRRWGSVPPASDSDIDLRS